jgi:polysaccharide pyruvyl transferase WcaK-like protein
MRVLLIDDASSNANWGDRASAVSLKQMILKSGATGIATISEHELCHSSFHNESLMSQSGPSGKTAKDTLKMFIPPVMLEMREKLIALRTRRPDDIIPQRWRDFEPHFQQMLKDRRIYSDLLNTIEFSDVIVIHGCELRNNGRDYRAYLFLSYVAKKFFKKPVILVNLTVDFKHPDLREIAEHLLPLFDDVVCRDVVSAERCKEFCNARFAPDTAFIFKPIPLHEWLPVSRRLTYFDVWPDTAQFDPSEPYICIGGSSIYLYNPQHNPTNGFSELIRHIKSIYPGQILLTVSGGPDAAWFQPIAADFKLPLISLRTPVQQAVDILGNAEAYVGGRWHAGIFALTGGTPIVALSAETFKMQALSKMAGLSGNTFDALNLRSEKDAIGTELLKCLEEGDQLRLRLRGWAEKESEKCWNNIDYLRAFSDK